MTTDQAPPGIGIRRGSPVLVGDSRTKGVVNRRFSQSPKRWFVNTEHAYALFEAHGQAMALDLMDETGFVHGVWAVAEAMALNIPTSGTMQPTSKHAWTITTNRPRGVFPASGPPMSNYNTRFTYEINDAIRRMMDRPGMAALWVVVPELKGIPNDQPQQALAAIMWHVFGDDDAK